MSVVDEDLTRHDSGDRTRRAAPRGLDPEADDQAGLLLGRYRLQRQLGTGAFGIVYRARDQRLDRDVAVKVLPRERVVHARFEREARAAARLQHPAIVTLYEAAVDDEAAYLVSELVRGQTVDTLLHEGKLSDRDIVEIGVSLCDALAHAHAQGVIHRDIKPSNMLVVNRPSAGGQRAKLTDFGVAHVVGGDSLTRTGDVIGTAAYMSPEQADGREAGPESDLYSLALVLYEALSGTNPVRDALSNGRRRRAAPFIPPLRRQRRDLPRRLAGAIDASLRARAIERGSLADLRAVLAESIDVADDMRGVVSPGWGAGQDDVDFADPDDREWREEVEDDHEERRPWFARGGQRAATGSAAGRLRESLPRGLSAAAAGLMTAWLSVHLLSGGPAAPAAMALVVAGLVLLLPRLGWLPVLLVLAVLAGVEGRAAGAIGLLMITVPVIVLLAFSRAGAPLPAGAVALGVVGLAGAWPAFVARTCSGWWRRAVIGAAGFIWLAAAGALWGRDLYWLPARVPPGERWTADMHVAVHQVLLPIVQPGLIGGALVWALVAALIPMVERRGRLWLDLSVAALSTAAIVIGAEMAGANTLGHAVLGAVVGGVITAAPALFAFLWDTRRDLRSAPLVP